MNVYYGEDSHGYTTVDDTQPSGYDSEEGWCDPEWDYIEDQRENIWLKESP